MTRRRAAIVIAVWLAAAGDAAADDAVNAKALLQQGLELYKAGKYDEAIGTLSRSYELDAQPTTLYALAQSERQAGQCSAAIGHYKALLEASGDVVQARAVQNNLELCEPGSDRQASPTRTSGPSGPSGPSARTSTTAIVLFGVGGLALGSSIGLFIAAGHSQNAASSAPTYDEYQRLTDRAGIERGFSYVSAGVAAVALGVGTFLVIRKPSRTATFTASTSGASHMAWLQVLW